MSTAHAHPGTRSESACSPETSWELTRAQRGIWDAQRLEPDSPYYVVGDVLEIGGGGPVDVEALRAAIRATTEEADSLRLRVFTTPDGPRQEISAEPVPLPEVVDLRGAPDPVAAAHALVDSERRRVAEACREMVERPLFSHTVLRLTDREVWFTQLGHHLVFDGYTAAMLARRTAAHYTALVSGSLPAPSPFGRFADVVAADRAYLASERAAQDRAYWRARFTPLPDLDDIAGGTGLPERTVTARTVLPTADLNRLREVAESVGATWGEALIACYAAFLHRVLGRDDVVFALPLMCRFGSALRTPAMAVNVLPLRVKVFGGDGLAELTARVATAMREMRAHQRYRGEDLPRDLAVPGAGALLHGRGVNLKAFDLAIDFAGSTGTMRNVAGGPPEDMGLSVLPTGDGGVLLGFEVDARTHDQAGVDRRLDALCALIRGLTDSDAPVVGRVELVGPEDLVALLDAWRVEAVPGVPRDVPGLLADLLVDHCGQTVLVCGARRLSVEELVVEVRRLARALRARGVGADDVVALPLDRSADLVVALLAVLEAGAAFLPLDIEHPAPRLRATVTEAGAVLALASAATVDVVPPEVPRLVLDAPEVRAELAALSGAPLSTEELSAPRHPDHLAYVIFTSGSTGTPKGVLGRVGGLASLVHHHRSTTVTRATRAAGRRLRAAHTYSFAFDSALDQLLWLLCGHELHVYDADTARDATALVSALTRDGIDVVDTTPSMAAPLVDAGLLDGPHRPVLLILGGEAAPPALWRRVAASGIAARNLYGPTEATVDSVGAWLDGGDPVIGFPVPGTRVYLLDNALRVVPPGSAGELYLAGPHLARGYLDRPGATAERFLADPFGAPGDRMYRTGDLARWVPGRGLAYLGRRDGQVKVRGHRVELGEVEAALGALPGVGAAAAAVRTDTGAPRLVGYVVPAALTTLDPDRVRAELAERVPDHLVPTAVVVLDALPVTTNGKLDRTALPAPRSASGGRAPRTERERLLCAAVAEVVGAEQVSPDDDFFAVGGDSITAIGVSSRLRAHGVDLRPRDLLGRGSFAALAAAGRDLDEARVVEVDEPTGPVPAPPIVRALLDPHPDHTSIAGYAQWTALRVNEFLTLADLARGVRALVDHHDALRLRVSSSGELLVPPPGLSGPEVVESEGDDAAASAAALAAELDPAAGEVVRVALLRTPPGAPDEVVVVIHHLSVDGVSWRVLLADLRAACAGEQLSPVGTSWRGHALRLAAQGATGARRAEIDHWRAARDDFRVGTRPLDQALDTTATAYRTTTVASPEASAAVLSGLPNAYRAGSDEVLLAALVLALRLWRGDERDAVTVTVEGHGRDHSGLDLARTVGWFTAEHPLRLPADAVRSSEDLADALAGGQAAGRLVRAVKEAKRAVPDHGIGHGVLRHLDPETRAEFAAVPPPDVLLNYLGRFAPVPDGGWRLPDDDPFAVIEPATKSLEQVLALNCFVREGTRPRIAVEWTAAGLVVTPEALADLRHAWERALGALAAHAEHGGGLTPSDLPLVALDQDAIDELERHGRVLDVLPATPLQVGLAFHTQVRGDQDTDVYVVQALTLLRGALDPDRMRAATHELLRRHPALRVHLHTTTGGEVVQVIPAEVTLDWRRVDLTGHTPDERARLLAEHCRADLERPFDPAAPPLVRFLLCTLGPDEHRLVITNHHALLDGWSMPLVGRTLLATYAELGGGPAAPTGPSLTDYHRLLAGRDHTAGLAAWRTALTGLEAGTRLAPPAAVSEVARPERVIVNLGAEFSGQLRAFAREQGVTTTTVFQTAWGVLLGRLTGRDDVVFGCPVSGRPAELDGVERVIGQLGNTIAVRVRAAAAETATSVLARVQAESAALVEHHHVGLPDVQRAAGLGELFDTMLVMENFPLSSRNRTTLAPGLDLVGVDITDATHYPLTVIVIPGDEIVVGLGYQPGVFDEDTVRGYGRWLRTLLAEIVTDPNRPVARLRALDAAEHRAMLAMGEGPEPSRPVAGCLAEFDRWVRRSPDAEAVVCRDRTLTYAELDRRANRLAHALIAGGVRPQDPVAVLLTRDIEMVVALFGVFKAGAVHVPMDPTYPVDRLRYMVEDIAPAAVIATPDSRAIPVDAPVIDPTTIAGTSTWDSDPVAARRRITDDSIAYVIYTSGTTGKPKGVAIPHRGLPSLVTLQEDVVGIRARERYLHFASTSFDVAFWQFMLPLLSGGTSVIAPEEARVPGDELLDYIVEHRVTGVNLLPSFVAAIPDDTPVDRDVLVMIGAERLDPELAHRWGNRRALFNAYGPTEVTINSVTWRYRPDDPGPLPIGRPDPQVRAYVLDAGLQPVGVGVAGELYLGGPKLARGYVNRPTLTAERFVADPFGPPGSRCYRTGDLVRWRPDGQLVFLGRTDHQVKVRGFRIELSEIETVLSRHPNVRACAVIVREGRLVGYILPTDDTAPDSASLREHLSTDLPDHMVPTAFVLVDHLPLGPTGKLNRDALPDPAPRTSTESREPATPAETALLAVFREVLGNVHLDDSFLDIGGDSIVSLRVVSRARRAGLTLTARDVFEGGTIAGIAARCHTAESTQDSPAVGDAPLTPLMRSLLQRGPADTFCQWVQICVPPSTTTEWHQTLNALLTRHDALRAHLADTKAGLVLRIPAAGAVTSTDILTVVSAPDAQTTPAATTVFATASPADASSAAAQEHIAHGAVDPSTGPVVDAPEASVATGADASTSAPPVDASAAPAWEHIAGAAANQPPHSPESGQASTADLFSAAVDLGALARAHITRARAEMNPRTGPLLRAIWIDAGPNRLGRLILVAHHLVVDAVSWRILIDDLAQAHAGAPLPRHGLSLLGWATALREAAPARQSERAHWHRVAATPVCPLPALDSTRDTAATARHHHVRIDPATTRAAVTTLPAAYRTTPDTVLLTALARAIAAWRGTAPDLLVALEGHGRPAHRPDFSGPADLSQTVGWFTAVHPARIHPPAGTAPALRAVREHLRAAGDGLGHGILGDDLVRHPDVSWNYLGRFPAAPTEETAWQPPPDADPLGSGGVDLPLPHALMVNAILRDNELGVRFTWPAALFTPARIGELGERFAHELHALTTDTPDGEILPLTPLQELMLDQARTGTDPYTVQGVFTLNGPLNLPALRAAGTHLLTRHPNLGAVFPPGHAVQVIPTQPEPDFTTRDVDDIERDRVLAELLAEPFNLATGPLFRITVLHRGPNHHDLVLTTHHLLSDGWSAPRILTELFAHYTETDLPVPTPFSHYTRWLAAHDHTTDLRAWRTELLDLPEGDHLLHGRRSTVAAADPVLFTVPTHTVAALTTAATARGLTPNTMLQGAWAAILATRSGRRDVTFGTMVACRTPEVAGVEDILGLLANTVPVRVHLQGTVAEALADAQSRQQAMVEHQHIGIPELTTLTARERLFDTLLVFENYPVDPTRLREPAPGLTVTDTRFRERTHHPLTLTVVPTDAGWTAVLSPQAGLFDPGELNAIATDLQHTLRALPTLLDEPTDRLLGETT
ncbi:amino acid adenylation domain-containing protein [Actinokineospora auranticolor]|uniref:Non-ribosomal peptide synthase protein (TIGR01720 family)/amino acid adenylation domain-containing protein n=1 Tax=Actinokineospora auranticolor TaxID=155976 RepID=A0A2S6GF03_9PSEU|nr:non-ribosomal peptide synthetase [Actinokineospora auranticolor]PPK63696.1 non-ribosomal peptide synthase protein (TIGR01720 family)/amino acid adenylation domain-containing protein [Actinokineospora auranticolor]